MDKLLNNTPKTPSSPSTAGSIGSGILKGAAQGVKKGLSGAPVIGQVMGAVGGINKIKKGLESFGNKQQKNYSNSLKKQANQIKAQQKNTEAERNRTKKAIKGISPLGMARAGQLKKEFEAERAGRNPTEFNPRFMAGVGKGFGFDPKVNKKGLHETISDYVNSDPGRIGFYNTEKAGINSMRMERARAGKSAKSEAERQAKMDQLVNEVAPKSPFGTIKNPTLRVSPKAVRNAAARGSKSPTVVSPSFLEAYKKGLGI